MDIENDFIKKLSWKEAKSEISHLSELCTIIDKINPPDECFLLKVDYPFGAQILENTVFHLPNKYGHVVPLSDHSISAEIRSLLNYNIFPLGIIAKNNVEIYKELGNKVFSLAYYGGGLDVGIWEHLKWITPYNVSAGARSLYMLPSIGDTVSHKKLKKEYSVKYPPPTKFSDHWNIFRQITSSPNFTEDWKCQILFLTSPWIKKLNENSEWNTLQQYILQKGWDHSGYARRKSILETLWETFATNMGSKKHKADALVVDTLKHVIMIGVGVVPGSAPAISSTAGPISELQHIYQDCYGLKDYFPTIMQPKYLTRESSNPVYYSFQYPTLLESTPPSRNMISVIENMRELQEILEIFLEAVFSSNIEITNKSIRKTLQSLRFEFFHGDMYAYGPSIKPSSSLAEKDKNLLYAKNSLKNGLKFANNSSFVRGCVKISLE